MRLDEMLVSQVVAPSLHHEGGGVQVSWRPGRFEEPELTPGIGGEGEGGGGGDGAGGGGL